MNHMTATTYLDNRYALVQKLARDYDSMVECGIDTTYERDRVLRVAEEIEEQLTLMARDFKRVTMQTIPGPGNVK